MGRILTGLINKNMIVHLRPDFSTFIGRGGSGNPDIVLGNRHANLNIVLTQGPVTTSDHLPLYAQLATKPIIIRGRKYYKFKKANWEVFQSHINNSYVQEINKNGNESNLRKNKTQIDEDLNKWFSTIEEAMKKAIPTTNNTIMPHPRATDKQKVLHHRLTMLTNNAERFG